LDASAAANYSDAVYDEIFFTKEILTSGDIQRIANMSHALGFQRNYFSALMMVEPSFNPVKLVGGNKYKFNLLAREVLS
jgi:hypothetical protein